MPRAISKAERIRGFLIHHPELSYDQMAREAGSTVKNVQKEATALRRRGIPLPDRRGNKPNQPRAAPVRSVPDPAPTPVETAEPPANPTGSGIERVKVRLTPTRTQPAARLRCSSCGLEVDEKEAPEKCPNGCDEDAAQPEAEGASA